MFWLFPAGPYASVGASAQLAAPAIEHTSTSTSTEQRVIRSAGDLKNADVPVKYRITVTTQTGGQTGSEVDGSVRLLVPTDLTGLETHDHQDTTPRDDWAERVEFLAPEAVLLDEQAFFDQVSGKLHPSVTKFGAPGRTALREFASGGGLRQVLGTALSGSPVVSNDLASPHGSYREAVELRAKPTGVELLGTVPGDSEVKLTDSSVAGGSTSAASKSGGDVNGIFGGGAYIPGAVGGVAGVSASASAKVTQTSQSGTSVTTKTNLNAKGDIGLYKVTVDLAVTTSSGETVTVPAHRVCPDGTAGGEGARPSGAGRHARQGHAGGEAVRAAVPRRGRGGRARPRGHLHPGDEGPGPDREHPARTPGLREVPAALRQAPARRLEGLRRQAPPNGWATSARSPRTSRLPRCGPKWTICSGRVCRRSSSGAACSPTST